ncbi:MAG: hypothetical protein ACJ77K_17695 [Bacteroidia bacterium]
MAKKDLDLDLVKAIYEKLTLEAEEEGGSNYDKSRAMVPYIVDWGDYFNETERKIWDDLRTHGVWLYPKYPIDKYFIQFGNPFYKVGVHITYNNSVYDQSEKLLKLREQGWVIYEFPSKYVFESAEGLYMRLYGDERSDNWFDDLSEEETEEMNRKWDKFVYDNRFKNSECFALFLKGKYFQP